MDIRNVGPGPTTCFLFILAAASASAAVSVSVTPDSASLRTGDSQFFFFNVAVSGATDLRVKWYVNEVEGGNAVLGTVSTGGKYTVPALRPAVAVSVKAVSVADPTRSDASPVSLLNPVPWFTDVQPRYVNTGLATAIRVYGSRFVSGAQIVWGSIALPTTFVSATELRASHAPAEAAGATVSLRVRNPNPGAIDSSAQTVTLLAPISVTVSPSSASLPLGSAAQFPASIYNSQVATLNWSVNGIAGGNATVGTITAQGLYTTPAVVPTPNVVAIKATSAQDPRASATSTVTLLNLVPWLTDVQPRFLNSGLATTIRAYGSRFVAGATIYSGSVPLATTFVSATELRAPWTPTDAAGATVSLKVRNPDAGADSNPQNVTILAPISVTINPPSITLRLGAAVTFPSSINNSQDPALNWSVNGIAGGNATVGTISAQGLYTMPAILPTPNVVEIKAASAQDSRAFSKSTLTLLNALPVVTGVTPATLTTATTSFIVNGTGFAPGAVATLDGRWLALTFVSPTQLNATGVVTPPLGGYAALKVANPDPGTSVSQTLGVAVNASSAALPYSAACRFLEQASWGPATGSVQRVIEIGRDAWLTEQFGAAPSGYSDNIGANPGLTSLQSQFMRNAVNGTDQLRQRAAFALGQLFVVSGQKLGSHPQMAPYQRLLLTYAFGNFRDLLREVTLSPAMGDYLDMANNDKPNPTFPVLPNENYAREVMQLFTMGSGAYTETDVKQLALALTGWTYPPAPGAPSAWPNPRYYTGQMVAFEGHHDTGAKTILGSVLAAGRTARQDLDAALDVVFNHPRVPSFVGYRLIQRLVTGNPSAAYVGRVAAVFANNGQGVRGDLKAVIRAILLDPEAATAAASTLPADQGHLREPVLYVTTLLRALGAVLPEDTNVALFAEATGQKLFYPPSAFNYFSPSWPIPGYAIPGPEFQILNASTMLARANFAFLAVHGILGASAPMPLDRFDDLGGNVPVLLDAIGNALLRGEMQADMRASITNALAGFTDPFLRARTALYLAATHARFQSQR